MLAHGRDGFFLNNKLSTRNGATNLDEAEDDREWCDRIWPTGGGDWLEAWLLGLVSGLDRELGLGLGLGRPSLRLDDGCHVMFFGSRGQRYGYL